MGCQHPSFIHHKKAVTWGLQFSDWQAKERLVGSSSFLWKFCTSPSCHGRDENKKKFHCHHQNICLDDEWVTTPNLMDQSVWRALTVSSGVEVPHCYYTLKSYWQCDCCPLVYNIGLKEFGQSRSSLDSSVQCHSSEEDSSFQNPPFLLFSLLKTGALQGTEKHVRHRPDLMLLLTIQVCSLSRGDKRSCFMSAVKSMTRKEEEYLRTGWRRKLQTCYSQFSVLTPESSSRRIMICHGLQTTSMTWISGGSAGKLQKNFSNWCCET
ncbi:hypothetical protein CY35_06G065000 [Sphagnum magellanicum]|nr:hypothetical protein CY35_06G065000 [Sphagnum magellanicum]